MQTFTKVYDTYPQAQRSVTDLEAAGVPSSDISVVANKFVREEYKVIEDTSATATGTGLGAAVGGGAGVLAGLGMLAIPGLGPVVAAGWLASAAVGAIAGGAAGGVIGALVDVGTPEHEAHVYSEAVRRGGTLVTVRTSQINDQVDSILNRYQPIDPVLRRKEYEQGGWNQFDPMAPAYKPSESEISRMRSL
jgi:hypothetical protein